ncbi:MAG: exonuclease, partial [Flavobacteriaceae bacterium]|nr:exonuclease [Flavobacteriaceae bacterium]
LFSFVDELGYLNLQTKSLKNKDLPITTFANIFQARKYLMDVTEKYQLCQKLTGLYPSISSCFSHAIKQCFGACLGEESAESYNGRVQSVIDKSSLDSKNMLIIDKGRAIDERSVIWIENGSFRGMGFFDLNFQINNSEVLQSLITPMNSNKDAVRIIQSFMRKNKHLKMINLDNREDKMKSVLNE